MVAGKRIIVLPLMAAAGALLFGALLYAPMGQPPNIVSADGSEGGIQAAIDQATDNGTRPGTVIIPAQADYVVQQTIQLYSDLTIHCENASTTITLGDGVNASLLQATDKSGIQITNCRFDGNKDANTVNAAVLHFIGVTDSVIDGVTIVDARDKAVMLDRSRYNTITNSRVYAPAAHGILLTNQSNYNLIDSNFFQGDGAHGFGVYLFGSSYNTIKGNAIQGGSIGVAVEGDAPNGVPAARNLIASNIITDQQGGWSQAAIHLEDNTPFNIIQGNMIENNQGVYGHGILVLAPKEPKVRGVIIEGNIVAGNTGSGIRVNDLLDSVIQNNILADNAAFGGISITGNIGYGSQNLTINGNRAFDAQNSPVQPYGISIEDLTAEGLIISGNNVRGNSEGLKVEGGGNTPHLIEMNANE